MSKRPVSNLRRAVPAILFAGFVYAVLSGVVKAELARVSVTGILVWRYAISTLLFIPWMFYQTRGASLNLKPASLHLYWIRAGTSLAAVYLYSTALKTLSIGLTSLLFNTLPLFVPLVARVWKKVPIYHQLWWGFSVALVGVGLVATPTAIHWAPEVLFAIGAGLLGAISVVSLRFAHFTEPPHRINFYFFLIAFIILLPLSIVDFKASYSALSIKDALPLLVIGVAGILYQQSFSFALKNGPARFMAPFMYSTVIWGMIIDRWIWGTEVTTAMWVGTALIIFGNILIYLLYPKKDLVS